MIARSKLFRTLSWYGSQQLSTFHYSDIGSLTINSSSDQLIYSKANGNLKLIECLYVYFKNSVLGIRRLNDFNIPVVKR